MRFIIIERNSGYIWGDTAHFPVSQAPQTPIDAARMIDEGVGEHGRTYTETNRHDATASYDVYSVTDDFPVMDDGRDQKWIDAVERDGKLVTTLKHSQPME